MRCISLKKQNYPILPNRSPLQHFLIVVTYPLSRSKIQYPGTVLKKGLWGLQASRRALRGASRRALAAGFLVLLAQKWLWSTTSTPFGSASKNNNKDPTMALPWRIVDFKSTHIIFQIYHTIKQHQKSNKRRYVYDILKIELVWAKIPNCKIRWTSNIGLRRSL